MTTLVVIISAICFVYCGWRIVGDYYRGLAPMLSNRNLFLASLMMFQCLSAILTLMAGMPNQGITISSATYARFALGLAGLTICFMLFYNWKLPVNWLARHIPTRCPSFSLMPMAIILTIAMAVGLDSRFNLLPLPLAIHNLELNAGRGLICFSIIMLLWVWNQHKLNPISWLVCPGLVLLLVLSLLRGEFGRRSFLSGIMAVCWGLYFFRWQLKTAIMNTPKYALWAVVVLALVGGLSAIRSQEESTFSITYRLSAMTDSLNLETMKDLFVTDTFARSAYAIERYTTDLSPQPFNSTWYLLTYPIPRAIYPDKPDPLALILPEVATVSALKGFNWGPGIIGHAWHEGGFIFIIYFAAVFGLLYGAVDRRLVQQSLNPYFVGITGAALGQVLGMARGDIGFFMANWIFGVMTPMILVYVFGLFSHQRADVICDQWNAYQATLNESGKTGHDSPEVAESWEGSAAAWVAPET